MGLLDILNGMANGPRGVPDPRDQSSGGMSKSTMALLAFLAYKAYRSFNTQQPGDARASRDDTGYGDDRAPSRERYDDDERSRSRSGGLGDVLRDFLGGGDKRPDLLRRGVQNTVEDFNRSGHGDITRSWVDRGDNRDISPEQLEGALGEDAIRDLTHRTGMSRDELLSALREHLPRAIDELTPEGRLPTQEEADRLWRRH